MNTKGLDLIYQIQLSISINAVLEPNRLFFSVKWHCLTVVNVQVLICLKNIGTKICQTHSTLPFDWIKNRGLFKMI